MMCWLGALFLAVLTAGVAGAETNHDVRVASVSNLRIIEQGMDWVDLDWDLIPPDNLKDYVLYINNNLEDIISTCKTQHCTHRVSNLQGCIELGFQLVPRYTVGGNGLMSLKVLTVLQQIPGAPTNLIVSSTPPYTSTWNPPAFNAECVQNYKVCYSSSCIFTSSLSYTPLASNIQLCTTFVVTVEAIISTGETGQQAFSTFQTASGVPGPATDVVIGLRPGVNDTIELEWNPPVINTNCAVTYAIVVTDTSTVTLLMKDVKLTSGAKATNHATYSDLKGCTLYSISIYAVNTINERSENVTVFQQTDDTTPASPIYISVVSLDATTVQVNWQNDLAISCINANVICYTESMTPFTTCLPEKPILPGVSTELVITDLQICGLYEFFVFSVTIGGLTGNPISKVFLMPDAQPGPVNNLRSTGANSHDITFSFEGPTVNMLCAWEIQENIRNPNGLLSSQFSPGNGESPISSRFDNTFRRLEACSFHEIDVRTISRTGIKSEVRRTNITTLEAVPSSPQSLEAQEITSSSLRLKWYRSVDNYNCIQGYKITRNSTIGDVVIQITAKPTDLQTYYLVSNLVPDTVYKISLNAITETNKISTSTVQYFKTLTL